MARETFFPDFGNYDYEEEKKKDLGHGRYAAATRLRHSATSKLAPYGEFDSDSDSDADPDTDFDLTPYPPPSA